MELTPWIALSLTDHIGSKTLKALLAYFGDDPNAILSAPPDELQQVNGVGPKIAHSIQAIDLDLIEQKRQDWEAVGLSIALHYQSDTSYPLNLLDENIDDPPLTLFMRSPWQTAFNRAIAVVGTRNPSSTAADFAWQLGQQLATRGIAVVSGLALGIDTAALKGALSIQTGRAVAVLGSGVKNIYPTANAQLVPLFQKQGCILSEVAPDAPPSAPRLVARNRIISGLSRALIVVETAVDGGAMHAARFAKKQGRPIFTLDLPASGNQQLLADNTAQCINSDFSDLDRVLHVLEKHHA